MSRSAQRIVSTAQPLSAEKFWSDLHHSSARRKAPRVHANVQVRLSPPTGASVQTLSNDLSYHGMQLRCDRGTAAALRPHPRGEKAHPTFVATLRLEIEGVLLRVNAHARIAHVTLVADAPAETEVAIGMVFVRFEDGAQDALGRFIEYHLLPAGWP